MIDNSSDLEAMNLVELLLYFFKGSRVVNGGSVTVNVGSTHSVPVQGSGGEGHTQWVKAVGWETINHQPVVVVETEAATDEDINCFASDRSILTHDTYKLIRALIKVEVDVTNVMNGIADRCFPEKGTVGVVADGESSSRSAIAWGRASTGRVKLFKYQERCYAINLNTSKTISQAKINEQQKGKILPKKIIQWLPFGTLSEGFPQKPNHLR
jgi:hypothetical protein